MKTIQERIKSRRQQLKLTLEDVANALGVNKTTVMRYESESIKKLPTNMSTIGKGAEMYPAISYGMRKNLKVILTY